MMQLKHEQQKLFHSIIENPQVMHVLTCTPKTGNFFLVKYITQYSQTLGKNVLLTTTMGTPTFHLCSTSTTVHIAFRILVQGYLSILPKPSNVIEKLKIANVVIINEMSVMTNNILSVVEQRLKQQCLL
jgi:hypothetical protein